jgi:hypothetical protein
MVVDILTAVDMKGASVLRKKKDASAVCDNLCRAAELRDQALFKAALLGPRI